MKQRKIPMRTCIVTKEKLPKRELIRVLRTPEGNVIIDESGKSNGRGAYLKKDLEVITKAKKSKIHFTNISSVNLLPKILVIIPVLLYPNVVPNKPIIVDPTKVRAATILSYPINKIKDTNIGKKTTKPNWSPHTDVKTAIRTIMIDKTTTSLPLKRATNLSNIVRYAPILFNTP